MRGSDLRAARERLNTSRQQIAERVGVGTADVAAWESLGRVPRKQRFDVDLALWEIESEQALARSGLPECERVLRWAEQPLEATPQAVEQHEWTCAVCAARRDHVRAHVRRMPVGGGVLTVHNVAIALLLVGVLGLGLAGRLADSIAPATWEAALPALQEAAAERPDDPVALRELATAFLHLERWDEALPVLQEAVRLDPDDADLLNSLGWLILEGGEPGEAAPILERAIALEPRHTRARHNLAWAMYRMGRFEKADSAYRELIAEDPANGGIRGDRGWVLIETRQLDEAEAEFREAIRREPGEVWHHRGLATALAQNGQPQPALLSYRDATRLAPEDATLWLEIGRLAHFAGEFEESAGAFARAQELDASVVDAAMGAREMWEASRAGRPYEPKSDG
jgi:Tfp pilus assembly protein PilF/transcriptional regulator with XRE-family HTH domain